MYVLCICYVCMYVCIIYRFYNYDEVLQAKKVLYQNYQDALGPFISRKTSTLRSEQYAHVEDIINSMYCLDEDGKSLSFAAINLKRKPKWEPNKADYMAIAEKLSMLEGRLTSIERVATENEAEIIQNRDAINLSSIEKIIDKNKSQMLENIKPAYSEMTKKNIATNSQSVHCAVSSSSLVVNLPPSLVRAVNNNRLQQPEVMSKLIPPEGSQQKMSEKQSVSKPDDGEFQLQYYQRKRQTRRRKRGGFVAGKGTSNTLSGAPPPIRDNFVYRVARMLLRIL